jgi:hypothetical protein
MTTKLTRTIQRKKGKRKNTALKITERRSLRLNQLMTQLNFNLKIVSLLQRSKEDVPLETIIQMLRLVPS